MVELGLGDCYRESLSGCEAGHSAWSGLAENWVACWDVLGCLDLINPTEGLIHLSFH